MPDTQATTFRLTDILTKEVSLVDRAANQRVWLLVKRDETAARALKQDGQGGFTTEQTPSAQAADPGKTEADKPKEPPPGEQTPPAPQEPPADPAKEPAPSLPPAAGLDETVKMTKATYAGIAAAIEELTKLAQSVKPEELTDVDSSAVERRLVDAVSKLGAVAATPATEAPTTAWVDGVCKLAAKDLNKALKTASEKLGEIADALAIDTSDNPPAEEVRYRITDVLYALVQLSQFEAAEAALLKTDQVAQYRALAAGIDKLIAVAEVAPVSKRIDESHATKLVGVAEQVIKAYGSRVKTLMKRVRELEEEPLHSNRLSVDLQKQQRVGEAVWPLDMNAKHLVDQDYDFDVASAG